MRIPSIFRPPKYQRFNITPRYYDPVKEEITERTARIQRELNMHDGQSSEEPYHASGSSRISGSFRINHRKRKSGSAALMQLVIVFLLVGMLGGYIYFGNIALYIFLLVSSVLLYLKIKRII